MFNNQDNKASYIRVIIIKNIAYTGRSAKSDVEL